QYDAFGVDGGSVLTVRWVTLPSDPSVNFSSNGNQWFFSGTNAYVTIRGFTIRRGIRAAVSVPSAGSNITIQDNIFRYFNDSGNGSARPIEVDSATSISILDNELAYSSSEPLHIEAFTDGTVSAIISRNWVHNIGDQSVLGNGTLGTPNCTTFTSGAP